VNECCRSNKTVLSINTLKKIQKIYLQLPKKHKIIISAFSLILIIMMLIPAEQASASKQSQESALQIGQRYQLALPEDISEKAANEANITKAKAADNSHQLLTSLKQSLSWINVKVKSGDSLARILNKQGFSAQDTYAISHASGKYAEQLKKINVGETLSLGTDKNNNLVALLYPFSKTETLIINQADQGFTSSVDTKTVESRIAYAHGTIQSSLWNAGLEAGITDNQIIELANIFGWDIDFAQDLRKDDAFNIVYEKNYIEGEYIGVGNILAAEFINQNETFQAIRFTDGEYYTPEGKSMRKAFLRAPVNFRYISSNFKKRRFHPIQKKWKAHNGTDYRANTGTPVRAAGDGRVIKSTYNKYNGNYVFIRHGNNIVTKYLHFSKRAVKQGQFVKQGQIIGYVGMTGLAEAPHLHYEFLLNGVHRNPRTVKLPDANPIAANVKQEFLTLAEQRLKELAGARNTLLAMQNSDD
jgi:murein DD-endopeptidase MepM/ murein hydrolase activator NlpD